MKKILILGTALIAILLCTAQSTWAKCAATIKVPSTACVGHKEVLSIIDYPIDVDPCPDCPNPCADCIKPSDVEWIITDPGSSTTVYTGTPLSYVFTMVGTYKVCVKWYDNCTNETGYKCYEVVVTSCCTCDMKIVKLSSTTDNASGYTLGSFYINSGSKKVISMELSIPFWNYDLSTAACKFDCSTLTDGYRFGNIVKYSSINDYFPAPIGCFDEFWAREVDWTFPSPQYIDQEVQFAMTVPPTDCYVAYFYCVKVLLHYDDCTTCECTFCFKGDKVICSCDPAGSASDPAAKGAKGAIKTGGLNDENVKVFPNPNGGQFTVQMEKTTDSKVIAVMDMTGKIVTKSILSGDNTKLELNNVAPGTYNVVITGDGNTVTKRVVITK